LRSTSKIATRPQSTTNESSAWKKNIGGLGTLFIYPTSHRDLALIHTEKYPWGIHHFGFKVDSVKEIEKIADTKAEDNTYGAIAEVGSKMLKATASTFPSTAGRFDISAGC
jgi:hypothetical protein